MNAAAVSASPVSVLRTRACPSSFALQEHPGNLQPVVRAGCGGLKPSQACVAAVRARRREDVAVTVEVDQRDPQPLQPADRLEGNEAVTADHDEPADPMGRTRVDAPTSITANAVLDDELTSLDEELDPIAAGDADPGTAEMVSEGGHD